MGRTMVTELGAALAVSKVTDGYCECIARSREVKDEPRGRRSIEQHVAWKLSRFRSREKFATSLHSKFPRSTVVYVSIPRASYIHRRQEGRLVREYVRILMSLGEQSTGRTKARNNREKHQSTVGIYRWYCCKVSALVMSLSAQPSIVLVGHEEPVPSCGDCCEDGTSGPERLRR